MCLCHSPGKKVKKTSVHTEDSRRKESGDNVLKMSQTDKSKECFDLNGL